MPLGIQELVATLRGRELGGSGFLLAAFVDTDADKLLDCFRDRSALSLVDGHEGPISTVWHGPSLADKSSRTEAFDYHVDGVYLERLPDFVALYCLDPGRGDSPTTFVDSRTLLKAVLADGLDIETLADISDHYLDRSGATVERPILNRHPRTGEWVLNYYNGPGRFVTRRGADRALERRTLDSVKELLGEHLTGIAPQRHHWGRGLFLMWDNHTFLHGRLADAPDQNRKLLRAWFYVDEAQVLTDR